MILFLFFALPCFVPVAVGQRTANVKPSTAPKFRIGGAVVSGLTGEILRNAGVTMGQSETGDALQSTATGDDGGFRFEGVAAGKYWLRAHARGFVDQAFDEHEGFSTGIVVGGAVDAEHLMFRLTPVATIAGQIVDEANEPVRDAQVMLYQKQLRNGREVTSWTSTAPTNDEGRYRFRDLGPGTYLIAVQARPWYARDPQLAPRMVLIEGGTAEGATGAANPVEPSANDQARSDRTLDVTYPVTFYPGATDQSGAAPVVLKGGDRQTADVRMNAVAALHVLVHRPTEVEAGPVVANLTRRIFGAPQMPVQVQSTQTQQGEMVLSGVAPGEYEVRVRSFGKTQETWTQQVVLITDTELNVSERPVIATVKGVVKMEGGATTGEQWLVQLVNRATRDRMNATVMPNGEFDFASQAVAPGTYEVSLGNAQDARVSRIAASGAKVMGQNIEISGAVQVQLTIMLREGLGRVNGTVLREGKGVAGAMVVLVPPDPGNNSPLVRRDQSDMDGTFSLRDVLPGKYTVVAIHDGWEMDWMDPRVLSRFLKGGEAVEVRADGKYEVKVGVQ
jgi:hypothetical protein